MSVACLAGSIAMPSPDSLLIAGVSLVAVVAVLALAWRRGIPADHPLVERAVGRVWPDLWRLRRRVWPRIEQAVPRVKAVLPARSTEHVGYYPVRPGRLRRALRERADVYPNNLAALKYRPRSGTQDGRGRRYEVGSYAWRPEGVFGADQVHVRLFSDGGATYVVAHHEVSPLAGVGEGPVAVVRQAVRHYRGVTLDDQRGVEKARELLDDLGY